MPDINAADSKVRIPLDHPDCEALAKRIFFLGTKELTDDERGLLIKQGSELRKLDHRLARLLCGAPLPVSDFRPLFWNEYCNLMSPMCGKPAVLVMAGWVHRLREYVEKIERKYLVATALADEDWI